MFDLAAKLRSIARRTTIIGLDIYDRLSSESLLPALAEEIPNPGREKLVTLEWVTVIPILREWIGERRVQKAKASRLEIRSQPYEVTFEFDTREAERENSQFQLERWTREIMKTFALGKIELSDRVLRENLMTYDGQDLFDTAHPKEDEAGTFSNIVEVARVNSAAPTIEEARREMKAAKLRLVANSLRRTTIVDAEAMAKDLVVISRSAPVYEVYEELRTEEQLEGGRKNMLKGTFRHLHSVAQVSNDVDFIHAAPDAPRPVVFVPNWEPQGVQFDESKLFSHKLVPFGSDCEYSAAALLPHATCRVKPA